MSQPDDDALREREWTLCIPNDNWRKTFVVPATHKENEDCRHVVVIPADDSLRTARLTWRPRMKPRLRADRTIDE